MWEIEISPTRSDLRVEHVTLTLRKNDRFIESFPVEVTKPDSSLNEAFDWYFEHFPRHSQSIDVNSLDENFQELQLYGQTIFESITQAANRHATTKRVLGNPSEISWRICESKSLTSEIYWELMTDKLGHPLVASSLSFLRYHRPQQEQATENSRAIGAEIRLLYIISRTTENSEIPYRSVALSLLDKLNTSKEVLSITVLRPATLEKLEEALEQAKVNQAAFNFVHFDGHGCLIDLKNSAFSPWLEADEFLNLKERFEGFQNYLLFEDEFSGYRPVHASQLAPLLSHYEIISFTTHACQSASLNPKNSRLPEASQLSTQRSFISQLSLYGIPFVAGMQFFSYIETAKIFFSEFFKNLIEGSSIQQSFSKSREFLHQTPYRLFDKKRLNYRDWSNPILYGNYDISCSPVQQEVEYSCSLGHKVFGRDREIFYLDGAFEENDVVFITGLMGIGKHTLGHEYVRWRKQTNKSSGQIFPISREITSNYSPDDFFHSLQKEAAKYSSKIQNSELFCIISINPYKDSKLADQLVDFLQQNIEDKLTIINDNFNTSVKILVLTETIAHLEEPLKKANLRLNGLDAPAAAELCEDTALGTKVLSEEEKNYLLSFSQGHPRALIQICRELSKLTDSQSRQAFVESLPTQGYDPPKSLLNSIFPHHYLEQSFQQFLGVSEEDATKLFLYFDFFGSSLSYNVLAEISETESVFLNGAGDFEHSLLRAFLTRLEIIGLISPENNFTYSTIPLFGLHLCHLISHTPTFLEEISDSNMFFRRQQIFCKSSHVVNTQIYSANNLTNSEKFSLFSTLSSSIIRTSNFNLEFNREYLISDIQAASFFLKYTSDRENLLQLVKRLEGVYYKKDFSREKSSSIEDYCRFCSIAAYAYASENINVSIQIMQNLVKCRQNQVVSLGISPENFDRDDDHKLIYKNYQSGIVQLLGFQKQSGSDAAKETIDEYRKTNPENKPDQTYFAFLNLASQVFVTCNRDKADLKMANIFLSELLFFSSRIPPMELVEAKMLSARIISYQIEEEQNTEHNHTPWRLDDSQQCLVKKAESALYSALSINPKGNVLSTATIHLQLGSIYSSIALHKKSIKHLEVARDLFQQSGSTSGESIIDYFTMLCYFSWAEVSEQEGKTLIAKKYFNLSNVFGERSHSILKKTVRTNVQEDIFDDLSSYGTKLRQKLDISSSVEGA